MLCPILMLSFECRHLYVPPFLVVTEHVICGSSVKGRSSSLSILGGLIAYAGQTTQHPYGLYGDHYRVFNYATCLPRAHTKL